MIHTVKRMAALILAGAILSGCTTLSPQLAFDDVALEVEERTGQRIEWDRGTDDDLAARAAVEQLLKRPLTMKSATQIALLNNRGLIATYTELGIAQASLVQAGLLKNPIFDFSSIDPVAKGPPDLTYAVVFQFIDAVFIPLRRRVAKSQLEEAKIAVTSQVIDHAAATQSAFIDYLAARQLVGLFKQVEKSARATLEAAKALRKAGNINVLDFETQQGLLTQAKLDHGQADALVAGARERLNTLLGLSGRQTHWRTAQRLPSISGRMVSLANIEKRAIEKSLDLAAGRQRLLTLAHQYGVDIATSIIPDLEIGLEVERGGAEREWGHGPSIGAVLPIFDQGQAKRATARMRIRKAQDMYWDTAVQVRSAARMVRANFKMARQQVRYYNKAVLPQTARILKATQLDVNAMQAGVFRLLLAKRDQIQAGQRYIQALQAYWQAVVQYKQLMSGRLPTGGAPMGAVQVADGGGGGGGGH